MKIGTNMCTTKAGGGDTSVVCCLRAYLKSPFRLKFSKFWLKNVQFSSMNLDSPHQIAHFFSQNLKNSSGKRDFRQALIEFTHKA